MAEVQLNHKQTNHVSPIEVIYKITNSKMDKKPDRNHGVVCKYAILQ